MELAGGVLVRVAAGRTSHTFIVFRNFFQKSGEHLAAIVTRKRLLIHIVTLDDTGGNGAARPEGRIQSRLRQVVQITRPAGVLLRNVAGRSLPRSVGEVEELRAHVNLRSIAGGEWLQPEASLD